MDCRALFDEVYEGYFQRVYAYFVLCFSRDAAEDLCQRVFLKVWRALNRIDFQEPESWKAWIFRVTVNEKNEFLRESYAKPEGVDLIEADGPVEEQGFSPERMDIRRAFSSLKEEERELLLLKANGFSSKEIGKLLNLPDSTVRSRVSAAKARLQRLLQERGVNGDG